MAKRGKPKSTKRGGARKPRAPRLPGTISHYDAYMPAPRMPTAPSLDDLRLPRHAGPRFDIDPHTALTQRNIARAEFSADLDDILAGYVPRIDVEYNYMPTDIVKRDYMPTSIVKRDYMTRVDVGRDYLPKSRVEQDLVPKSSIPSLERLAFMNGVDYGRPKALAETLGYKFELNANYDLAGRIGGSPADISNVLARYDNYRGESGNIYYFPKLDTISEYLIDINSDFSQKLVGEGQASIDTLSGAIGKEKTKVKVKGWSTPKEVLKATEFTVTYPRLKLGPDMEDPYIEVLGKYKKQAKVVSDTYIASNMHVLSSKAIGRISIEQYLADIGNVPPPPPAPPLPAKLPAAATMLAALPAPAELPAAPPAPAIPAVAIMPPVVIPPMKIEELPAIGIVPAVASPKSPALQPAPPKGGILDVGAIMKDMEREGDPGGE